MSLFRFFVARHACVRYSDLHFFGTKLHHAVHQIFLCLQLAFSREFSLIGPIFPVFCCSKTPYNQAVGHDLFVV